jgi:putative inorganic carbon (HCO3(-)) transporter
VFLFFAERRLLGTGRKDAWRTLAIFGLGSLCLLLSLTRSCWIGFIGGSIYLVLRALREGTVRPRRLAALSAVALVALVVVWGPVHERLGANHEGAAEERFQLNSIDLEMIRAHPFLGVGINNAYDSIVDYVPWWFGKWDWVYLAHNQYLHVAAETGLPGLAAFVWLLWVTLRALLRSRRTGDPLLEDTVTALLAGVGSLIWGMYLDFYSGMQMYVLLWFTLGASIGVATLCARERAG